MVKVWCKSEQNQTKDIKVIEQRLKILTEGLNDGVTDMLKTVYPPKTPFCGGYKNGHYSLISKPHPDPFIWSANSIASIAQMAALIYKSYHNWASSWDYGTHHTGDQQRLRRACVDLRIRTVSPEPSLFAHMKYGSRRRVRPKIRHHCPTGWLRMRVWKKSLRRTKSTIISWDGLSHSKIEILVPRQAICLDNLP